MDADTQLALAEHLLRDLSTSQPHNHNKQATSNHNRRPSRQQGPRTIVAFLALVVVVVVFLTNEHVANKPKKVKVREPPPRCWCAAGAARTSS